jgi:hypothetical protein
MMLDHVVSQMVRQPKTRFPTTMQITKIAKRISRVIMIHTSAVFWRWWRKQLGDKVNVISR